MKINLPTGLTQFAGRKQLLLQKNAPGLLFAVGLVGFGATVIMASRSTLRVPELLEDIEADKDAALYTLNNAKGYTQDDYNKEVTKIYALAGVDLFKLYGPAIVVGGVSVACLTGSHHILNTRNAGLSAAYAALDKGFTQYRNRVRAELGEEKDQQFRHGHEVREVTTVDENGVSRTVKIKHTPPGNRSIYSKFFDQLNINYEPTPEYNAIFLHAKQRYANEKLRSRGHLFLNEVYESLGLEHTKEGAVVGWVYRGDGDGYVDFGIFRADDPGSIDFVNGREAAIILDFNVDGVIYDLI